MSTVHSKLKNAFFARSTESHMFMNLVCRYQMSWNRERYVIQKRRTPPGLKNKPSTSYQMLRTTWLNYRYEDHPYKPCSLVLTIVKISCILNVCFRALSRQAQSEWFIWPHSGRNTEHHLLMNTAGSKSSAVTERCSHFIYNPCHPFL